MISSGARISTRLENPSAATAATVPVPSTWPWTMWPPSRSDGRSASSRLTRVPGRAAASEVRRSVWFITSASNSPSRAAAAVRHTPLTATESPAASWPASAVATVRRTPSAEASSAVTRPRSAIRPVNTAPPPPRPLRAAWATSPFPQPRAHEQVLSDPLAGQSPRPDGGGDPLDALALQRIAGRPASEDHRRQKQGDLVDLPRVQERAGQMRAPLQQQRRDPRSAQLLQRRDHARGLVLARGDDHLGSVGGERAGRRARRGARDDDDQRHRARVAQQARLQRQPRERVEHHPPRLAPGPALGPSGQQRVVGEGGADPDRDRVALRPPAVGHRAARLPGDPSRLAAAGGDLAVERHRGLE